MQATGGNIDFAIGNDSDEISEHVIARSLEGVRARIAHHEHERADIDRRIATAREEERLLQRLLELRRGGGGQVENRVINEEQFTIAPSETSPERRHPAVLAVIDELTTAGRPVHISELMRLLGQRKIAIPGAGSQANLIAHLRRDPRLVRTSRGMYGLTALGLENMTPPKRRSRKKRLRATRQKD